MSKPHVIMSIDSGTQSCRAFVWDQYGNCLADGRAEHSIDTPRLGWFEQDANEWWPAASSAICQALEKLLKAAQVELTSKSPQKIHRLENLAKKTTLNFTNKQYNILTDLSKIYSKIRYPDISQTSYNTKAKTTPIIKKAEKIYQWTLNKLKNQ